MAGERNIQAVYSDHLIVRTSWVYAARGNNFMKTIIKASRSRPELRVVDDQIGAPTSADLVADVTAVMLRSLSSGRGKCGLYHCVARGETSWFEVARLIVQASQNAGLSKNCSVFPIPTSEYPTFACRPLNSRLATAKLTGQFDVQLPDWSTDTRRILTEVLESRNEWFTK